MTATPRSWLLTVEDTSTPDMTGMVWHNVVALMVNGPRPIPAIEVEARLNAHDRLQAEHEAVTNLLRILEPLVFLKDRQGRVVTAIRNIKEARGEA